MDPVLTSASAVSFRSFRVIPLKDPVKDRVVVPALRDKNVRGQCPKLIRDAIQFIYRRIFIQPFV